jgi:hypothetical protein
MDKLKETLVAILLVVMTSIIILDKVIAPKEITTPNTIYNIEKDKELTKYVAVALNAYQIKGITLVIRYLSLEEQIYLSTATGFTSAVTQYKEGVYCISLIPTTPENSIRLIGHEIVHVKQLYDKRIIYSDTSFIWNGKELIKEIPPYKERPWEIEALTKEDSLSEIIKEHL